MANDTFTFKYDDKDVTITLYCGVFDKIGEAIGGVGGLDKITYDTKVQSAFMDALLTKYDDEGNECGKCATRFKLAPETASDILSWGVEQYALFILKSSQNMGEKMKTLNNKVAELQKSLSATANG